VDSHSTSFAHLGNILLQAGCFFQRNGSVAVRHGFFNIFHFTSRPSWSGSTSRACIVTAVVPMDVAGEAKALGEVLQKLQVTIASCHLSADLNGFELECLLMNWRTSLWFLIIFWCHICALKCCFLILPFFMPPSDGVGRHTC